MKSRIRTVNVQIPRDELDMLDETLHHAGMVTMAEREDRGAFMEFKLACGTNWRRVHDANIAFAKERENVAIEFSKKNRLGAPMTKPGGDNGSLIYDIDQTRIRDYEAAMRAVVEQAVTVSLVQVPFSSIPQNINASFLQIVCKMAYDVPAGF